MTAKIYKVLRKLTSSSYENVFYSECDKSIIDIPITYAISIQKNQLYYVPLSILVDLQFILKLIFIKL